MGTIPDSAILRRPLDNGTERRLVPRYANGSQVMLRMPEPARNGSFLGTGYARNLSLGGACLYTRHHLALGQRVQVSIPMEQEQLECELPSHFDGLATVLRVVAIDSQVMAVALCFDGALACNAAYATYIDWLCEQH